jgi:hypothetical protein
MTKPPVYIRLESNLRQKLCAAAADDLDFWLDSFLAVQRRDLCTFRGTHWVALERVTPVLDVHSISDTQGLVKRRLEAARCS